MLCFLEICLAVQMMIGGNLPLTPGYVGQMSGTQAIALGAHNNLSGAEFFPLGIGDTLTYNHVDYTVTETLLLQAVDPNDPQTDFIVAESGLILSARDAANLVFNRPGKLVLFTCLERNGDANWGRYFVFAEIPPMRMFPRVLPRMSG